MGRPRILVVDDEQSIRTLLTGRLEREGFQAKACQSAEEAETEFKKGGEVGVMITDLKMPGKDGFELMKWAKGENANLKTIVITGHGEKNVAVQALRQGASDYLEKPFDLDELVHTVRRCMREYQLEIDNRELVDRLEARVERVEGKDEDKFWYVSKSKSMTKVNDWLSVLRRESMRGGGEEPSVIVLGESGTGKEGIARMVHAGSQRGKGPWVAVNCANFSEQLLDSELFGHEKGSFTGANQLKRGLFEIAKGGTLFLDEIGEMDIKLQSKLLRVLQEKSFRRVGGTVDLDSDVRVVAATNRDLGERVKRGDFRDDLYHRLARVTIELPPLRDRTEDLVPMATQFAERAFGSRGKTFGGFTPEAEAAVKDYSWPGNVREMLNVVERIALIWQGSGPVSGKDLSLPGSLKRAAQEVAQYGDGRHVRPLVSPFSTPDDEGVTGYMELKKKWTESFEREYLINSLTRNSGNVSAASREAQIDRSNYLRLLRRYGIRAVEYRKAA